MKNRSILSIFTLSALLIGIFTQTACSKSGANEQEQILAYAKKNNSTYVQDPSGLYYLIVKPGSGTKPRSTSTVSATYVGTYLNDKIFDARTADFRLNGVIQGWQIGLQMIAPGGEIKLLIPSSLGYGPSDYNGIPGGSPLYFNVKLESIITY